MEKTLETLEVGKDGTTVIQGNTLLTERKIDKEEYILKTDNGYWKIRLTDYLFRFFDNLYMSNIEWLAYSKDGITYEAIYSGAYMEELMGVDDCGLAPFHIDADDIKCELKDDLISRQAAIDAIKKDVMGGLNYESILKELPSEVSNKEAILSMIEAAFVTDKRVEHLMCKDIRAVIQVVRDAVAAVR